MDPIQPRQNAFTTNYEKQIEAINQDKNSQLENVKDALGKYEDNEFLVTIDKTDPKQPTFEVERCKSKFMQWVYIKVLSKLTNKTYLTGAEGKRFVIATYKDIFNDLGKQAISSLKPPTGSITQQRETNPRMTGIVSNSLGLSPQPPSPTTSSASPRTSVDEAQEARDASKAEEIRQEFNTIPRADSTTPKTLTSIERHIKELIRNYDTVKPEVESAAKKDELAKELTGIMERRIEDLNTQLKDGDIISKIKASTTEDCESNLDHLETIKTILDSYPTNTQYIRKELEKIESALKEQITINNKQEAISTILAKMPTFTESPLKSVVRNFSTELGNSLDVLRAANKTLKSIPDHFSRKGEIQEQVAASERALVQHRDSLFSQLKNPNTITDAEKLQLLQNVDSLTDQFTGDESTSNIVANTISTLEKIPGVATPEYWLQKLTSKPNFSEIYEKTNAPNEFNPTNINDISKTIGYIEEYAKKVPDGDEKDKITALLEQLNVIKKQIPGTFSRFFK